MDNNTLIKSGKIGGEEIVNSNYSTSTNDKIKILNSSLLINRIIYWLFVGIITIILNLIFK